MSSREPPLLSMYGLFTAHLMPEADATAEAQRPWDVKQTSKFMQQEKGQLDFSMSKPEFVLSVMDRHEV